MDVRKYEVIEEVDLGDIILKPGAQVEIEFLEMIGQDASDMT